MAWWKKALIWTAVALGICVIIFYVFYYITTHYEIPSMTLGQYNLIKVAEKISGEETVIEEYTNGEYYIVVKEDLSLESHSSTKGIAENESGYNYFLHGNELVIFLPTEEADIAYTGHYNNGLIKISYVQNDIEYVFYYQLMEQNA